MTTERLLTPELDKQSDIIATGDSQAIGEFLTWLAERNIHLMRWETDRQRMDTCPGEDDYTHCKEGRAVGRRGTIYDRDCPQCHGTGEVKVRLKADYVADGRTTEQLLADFFGIDLVKIEAEKRALLRSLRGSGQQADRRTT